MYYYNGRPVSIKGTILPPALLIYTAISSDSSEYKVSGIRKIGNGHIIPEKVFVDSYGGGSYPVTQIYKEVFKGNTEVKRVTIPASIADIGFDAFNSCENLKVLDFDENCSATLSQGCFMGCNALEEVTIPAAITVSADSVFRECQSLKKATIYSTLGTRMFFGCENLQEVYIGDNVEILSERAFQDCFALNMVAIGSNVTTIKSDTFRKCRSLAEITIPAKTTSIASDAFLGCTGLTNIIVEADNGTYKAIDGNLYTIDGKTLKQYAAGKSDTSFTIPNTVTGLSNYAFYECTNLTEIIVPSTVEVIGTNTFRNSSNLKSVDFSSHTFVPTLNNAYAFGGTPRTPFIRVPASLYEEWIATEVWSTIAETGRIIAV